MWAFVFGARARPFSQSSTARVFTAASGVSAQPGLGARAARKPGGSPEGLHPQLTMVQRSSSRKRTEHFYVRDERSRIFEFKLVRKELK